MSMTLFFSKVWFGGQFSIHIYWLLKQVWTSISAQYTVIFKRIRLYAKPELMSNVHTIDTDKSRE